MATVDATNRTAAQADTSSNARKKTDTLGRDQFLKILLADFKTKIRQTRLMTVSLSHSLQHFLL